ncbi:RNA-binding domain superfamily [Sesbania bispinosa]|nr:RNA-binding domain superfamily [Sesbania bispinosa]
MASDDEHLALQDILSLSFMSPSSSLLKLKHKPQFRDALKHFLLCSAGPFPSLCLVAGRSSKARVFTALAAVVEQEHVERENDEEEEQFKQTRATEVYVCNLPRSCDTEQLLHMFKPHGSILSIEVFRNPETGESKGSAYVTLGSINSTKNAIVIRWNG